MWTKLCSQTLCGGPQKRSTNATTEIPHAASSCTRIPSSLGTKELIESFLDIA